MRGSIMGREGNGRGQALVEFALAIPVFLVLLFGLLDVGRLVYVNNAVAQGAREAARWGSVQGNSATAADRTAVGNHARSVMAAVPSAVVTVTCERNGTTTETCVNGDVLVVRVQSTVSMLTPVIGQLVGSVPVTATAKVMVHQ